MSPIPIRPVTDEEYPAFVRAIVEGFSDDIPDDGLVESIKALLPPERTLAALDGDEIVGTFAGYDFVLTVPGGSVAMEGTTVVTVFPTHRRMGVMKALMAEHLANATANGYPIAGLWASESSIYGRFGYGIASYADTVTMVGRDIVLRDDVEVDRVRRINIDDAPDILPGIFAAVLPEVPGMFARSEDWWKYEVLLDAEWTRRGKTRRRVVVHEGPDGPDGYALYRQKGGEGGDGHANGTVHVMEVIAASDRAHASLWSYLTQVDGCPNVRLWNLPVDDPLPMKIVEPRRIKRETRFDALWIAVLDVVAALEGRTYEHDGSVLFRVRNSFGSDTDGVFELVVTDGIGSCARSDAQPDIEIDHDVLGALYLGGGDALAHASAGRIGGESGKIAELNRMMGASKAPWCNQVF